jgi:hypothetical protein
LPLPRKLPEVRADYLATPAVEGLRLSGAAIPAASGVYAVLGPNNAGKTRWLGVLAAAELAAVVRPSDVTPQPEHFPDHAMLRELWPQFGKLELFWPRDVPEYSEGVAYGAVPASVRLGAASEKEIRRVWSGVDDNLLTLLRANLWPHLVPAPAVIVSSNRFFPHRTRLQSSPSLENVQQWPVLLANMDRSKDKELRAALKAVKDSFTDITEGLAFHVFVEDEEVHLHISEGDGPETSLHECGDGLRDLIGVILHVERFRAHDLLIDEPGLRLHPTTQRRLLAHLEQAARSRQVWIASHDGAIVGSASVSRRFFVHRDAAQRMSTVSELADRAAARTAMLQLGWSPSDAFLADRVLLCEGESDRIVFEAVRSWLEETDPTWGGLVVSDLGGTGVVWGKDSKGPNNTNELVQRIDLARRLSPHASIVALLDSDGRTTAEQERLEKRILAKGIHVAWLDVVEIEDYWLTPAISTEILKHLIAIGSDKQDGAKIDLPAQDKIEATLAAERPPNTKCRPRRPLLSGALARGPEEGSRPRGRCVLAESCQPPGSSPLRGREESLRRKAGCGSLGGCWESTQIGVPRLTIA